MKISAHVFTLISGLFLLNCAGPNTLQTWADKDNLSKKIMVYSHLTPNLKKIKEGGLTAPKKVGLISFYLLDNGTREFSAMAYSYGGTYETTAGLTPKGANHFATKFSETGVPALKKVFAAHGMDLLTPIEFVTTDAQKEAYVNFKLPMGGLGKATMAMVSWISKTPNISSSAAGFSSIMTHLWADKDGSIALEELRTKLGLDAMVVLANVTLTHPKGVLLTSVSMLMHGQNPMAKSDNWLAAKAWWPGVCYARGDFAKGYKAVEFVKMKKGKIIEEHYEGYGKIIEILADATLNKYDVQ